MSLLPKKNLFSAVDSVLPSRHLLKFRKFLFFEPFIGHDIANRGRFSHYGCSDRKEFARILKKIRSETELLLEDIEAYHIYMAVKRTQKVPGDIAEVGGTKAVRQRLSARQRAINPFTSLTRSKGCRKCRYRYGLAVFTKANLPHRSNRSRITSKATATCSSTRDSSRYLRTCHRI